MKPTAWQAALGGAALLVLDSGNALAAPSRPEPTAASAVHGDPGCLPRAGDGGAAEPSREALRAAGIRIAGEMIPARMSRPGDPPESGRAAPEMNVLTMDGAFAALWARCGLTRRDRSLVTLGMLIAQRANSELEYHFRIARANGLTPREIDEIVYQATAYAGFPAASNAMRVQQQVLKEDAAGK